MTLALNHGKSRIHKFIGGGIKPIIQNPVFFIFQAIIISAPLLVCCIKQYISYGHILFAFPIIIFAAYILSIIISHFQKSKIILYLISYIFSISEIFLILNFGTRFSLLILQLIAETNPNEASEFISSYIISSRMLIYYFLAVSFIGFNIISEKSNLIQSVIKQITLYIPNKIYIGFFCILLISGTISISRDIRLLYTFYSKHFKDVPGILFNVRYSKNYTTLGNIVYASYFYFSSLNETEILAETLQNIPPIKSDITSQNIILILGESFNKSHSSLYGYSIDTNPKLKKEGDNLFLMNDVVSPSNATASCLRLLFSFSNRENDLYWANTPLFPALYKAAGYNVIFLSNQECQGHGKDIWDSMNNCLANDLTIPYLYDYINSSVYKHDIDLIKEYESIIPSIENNLPKLVMFHLLGQHTEYKERYPESETVFTKDNYQHRTDLNEKQKEIVAHYDNATLYNDKVVSSIIDTFRDEDAIIIYLSDHGDEVYDYRDKYGRSHESIISKGRAMSQYEVPFMIWVSDKYKETHPDIIKRINDSVDRPFMTDDLPHLMLDLAGIKCDWFEPSRSLINDQYNVNRKRLLEDSKQDYDEIMKSTTLN